jgi:hypothetical protein
VVNVIHDIALLVTLAFIWWIPAVLVARLARRRGRSFESILVAALVIPWPVVLLIILAVPRRNEQ